MIRMFVRLLRDTRGATAIEYGLILTLVVIALMAGLVMLANATVGTWSNVSAEVIKAAR
jgi:pilus assembly protein Flp/PilA